MRKPTKQQCKKKIDKECLACGETKYELLDAHRMIEGGEYKNYNMITLCSNCHRRTHAGEIKFDRKYSTTIGKLLLHWWLNGEEKWTQVVN